MANEVNIKVTVDGRQGEVSLQSLAGQFQNLLNNAEQVKQGLLDKFSNIGNIFTGINQGVELIKKTLDFLNEPLEKFAERTKLIAGLGAVLKSTGRDAEFTVDEIVKMANGLREVNKYTVGVKDIIDVQSIVLGFENISKKAIPEVNQTIIDLSKFMKSDLRTAAMTVGMALEAPEMAARRLRQTGIVLDAQQQKNIKTLVEQGKAYEAQSLVLELLKKRVDGFAISQSTPLQESFSKLKSFWDKMLIQIGAAITPFIESIVTGFTNYIIPVVTSGIETISQLSQIISPIAKLIGGLFLDSIVGSVKFLWNFKDIIVATGVAIGILSTIINADVIALRLMYAWDTIVAGGKLILTAATNGLSIAQTALNAVMNMSPIGWIISIIGILITVITVVIGKTIGWGKAFEYLKAGLLIAWDYMKAFGNFVIQFSLGITQLLTLPYQIMYRTAVEIFSKIGSMMKKLVTGDFAGLWDEIKSGFLTGFNDSLNSLKSSFENAFNSFDGLGDKASQRWAEAGKTTEKTVSENTKEGTEAEINRNRKGSVPWKEDKAAIDKLEAEKKQKEAQAKETIDNELDLQQELLNIDRKYDLLKVKYEKEHENERTAAREKINADYDNKQSELNVKKRNALNQQRKEELDAAWELRNKELQYSESTDLDILKNKRIYLEMVRNLYKQNTKEYLAAQREINSIDLDILISERSQKKAQKENSLEINNSNKRLKLTKPGNEQALEEFDSKAQFDKEVEELQKKFDKEEITADDFFKAYENAEAAHQQRLLEVKTKYYDTWLGRLANLTRAEIETAKQIVDNIGDIFGKIGSIISQNAKDEAETAKASNKEKIEADREKALSYARTQQQKDKINKEYDAKVQKMEDEADKRAREKAADWFAVQRAASITNAIISTYEGANKTIAQGGFWGIALSIATIAAGLANVAVIASQPMPKYARGIIGINGPGTETSDSIPAWLSRNESVINADSTKAATPLLKLINGSAVIARRINNFLMNDELPYYAAGLSNLQTKYYPNNYSNTFVGNSGELLGEVKNLNKNMQKYAESGMNVKVEVGSGFANKLYKMGAAGMRKEKLA